MFEVDAQEVEKRRSAYRDAGAVFGSDLAKALLLAVSRNGEDRDGKVKFAAIVMREILAAVQYLRDAGAPSGFVQAYERAAREACRDELVRGVNGVLPSRAAA